ncbi:MAG: hypothetical protein KOO66_14165 [Bacteroidales bacterium]|nr:hypothetical protein [Bacteroidales bacterium]
MNPRINIAYDQLEDWIEKNGPLSYDVSDIKALRFFIFIKNLSHKSKLAKTLTAPLIYLSDNYSNILRKVFVVKKNLFPQGQAVIARAYFSKYKITKDKIYLEKAINILEWLKQNTSPGYNKLCWGQPYNWHSRKLFPENVPRATVTSQVANAFLDAYEILHEKKYLDVAESSCNFFIESLNWEKDKDGFICFSYTSVDNYNIHNSSMLAAAVLIRTWKYSGVENFKEYGLRAMNFTIKHQNENGSWYYWAPPDKIIGKIDNYHTGFILESLEVIKKHLGTEFNGEKALEKGLRYYLDNFFENSVIPKMTYKSTYPIDIQSCAQAIITLGEIKPRLPELSEKAEKIAMWTINNMMDKKGYFYYRIYKNGRIDKTPYIRWSESWMLRALTFLLKEK